MRKTAGGSISSMTGSNNIGSASGQVHPLMAEPESTLISMKLEKDHGIPGYTLYLPITLCNFCLIKLYVI